ncbi:restriction endonuclease subunit S [Clostridium bowmanii]|uniref:restriction endonuclease subunit S n=1 Tax=Clostridium bowmanii TaxID=132925 RepID=UPI001C0BB000|nr:restriction endonuclease subunit S [Clostridium bowmanii]MBU3190746.1 restriction endonuclease subunit S [Clostridium bowmanii]MCA1075008.1 restriction endonuclease subunit S [Clostridium bowmanii]
MKEVREGYKMTEVGEIPNKWEIKRLCDISEINPKKEIIEDDKDVSFIAMEDVSNQGGIIKDNVRTYGEVKKGYTAFKNNDVLLAKITPCFENGKKAIATQLINEVGFGSTEFHVLRAKKTESIPLYIYYTISSNNFIQQAKANMTGSAGQRRVPTGFLKEYIITTPPLEEQQNISLILSSVDEKIENTDKLIEKTKELRKGLMQKLLTKGIGHDRFKDTELGMIPEEWEIKRLIDIVDKSDRYSFTGGPFGSNLKSCDYTEVGVRVIQLQNIGDGYFNNESTIYTSVKKADELRSCNIYPGDILIAKMAEPVARACKIPCNEERYLMCSDGIRISVDKSENNVDYIKYSINSKYFRSNAIANSTGSTRLRIALNELRNLPVIIPSLCEQGKIASILSSIDEKIEKYESKKEKFQELKKGLMHKLMTGKIRVR